MNSKKILSFSLGPVGTAILGAITLPIMSWVFTPEDIGRMNFVSVVISFSMMFLVLGLDQVYVREFHATKDKNHLFKQCIVPGIILFTILSSASIKYGREISSILFGEKNSKYWILTLICISTTYLIRFFGLTLRMQERGLAFSISQIAPKILQIIFLSIIIHFNIPKNFTTILWMLTASSAIVAAIYAWNINNDLASAFKKEITFKQIVPHLKFGIPLVFTNLAYWGLSASSVLILQSESTLEELGIYSVASGFASSAAIFQSIFTIIWAPTVYKWVESGVDMSRINSITNQALAVACTLFITIGLFSSITDILLPPHYISVKYLIACAITPSLLYTLSEITCIGIGITRRTSLTIWITLSALATNTLLNLYLTPKYGAAGAIISNAISYVVFFIARTEVSSHIWRQFPRKKLYFSILIPITLSIITAATGDRIPFHFSIIWLSLAPIIAISFRKDLIAIFYFFKSKKI